MAAADEPRAVFEAYRANEAAYLAARDELERRIREALTAVGIRPSMIVSRAKDAVELYKKQRRKAYVDFWATCPDVIGVRVVVSVAGDKIAAQQALEASDDLEVFKVEDQAQDADPNLLAYHGLHVHVRAHDLVGADGAAIRCEVQIRTLAEHAWAETEHRYLYKKSDGIPKGVRRIFRRLLVLVELFDEELQKGVELVKKSPAFARHNFLRSLEQRFAGMTTEVGDERLTKDVLETLARNGYDDVVVLNELVATYLDAHEDDARKILELHGANSDGFDPDDAWILTQPESILLLALLDQDEYQLAAALQGEDLSHYVEPLARWADHPGFFRA
ncbi:hypothetical protein [Microbacterium sp. 179-I 3D3 NHS]|uniref:hypothetical protein n=1 Tax=Microbacterium sp. 179-I 3D3 NHS TaxID=3142382 RepID=UPI0039A2A99D